MLERHERSVEAILQRSDGDWIVMLLRRLGFWVNETKDRTRTERPFPTSWRENRAGQVELGDELAYWSSEYGRVCSLLGALDAERSRLKSELAMLKARIGDQIWGSVPENDKKPAKWLLDQQILSHRDVREQQKRVNLVETAYRALVGAKEACGSYRDAVSREITRRGGELKRLHT